ncbi:hypothetical protein HPB50_004691 [Hyalomma asiaticum]|uniref:Uncharacterized protein n=1 Tax=Hyalomma asiaticum TaxID=266040 RepID=A0ACB7SV67_HYAAI|nr:hypothetical protein HPB50_004691 [Hyalomma asiaticum]
METLINRFRDLLRTLSRRVAYNVRWPRPGACTEEPSSRPPTTTCSAEAIRSIARSSPAPFAWALLPANRDDGDLGCARSVCGFDDLRTSREKNSRKPPNDL